MINEKYARQYCKDDISTIENYSKAMDDKTQIWHLHHRREIEENKSRTQLLEEGLYYHRPSSELIFLTQFEHRSLHKRGNKNCVGRHFTHSEETKRKLSEAMKKNKNFFGKTHS